MQSDYTSEDEETRRTLAVEDDVRPSSPDWDYDLLEASFSNDKTVRGLAKNAQRREARREAAMADPEAAVRQRIEAGRARAGVVGDLWKEQVAQRLRNELALYQVLDSSHHGGLSKLKAAVAARLLQTNQLPISDSSPVWERFEPRMIELLLDLAQDPATVLDPYIVDGTIRLSQPGDSRPISCCQSYIRQFTSASGPSVFETAMHEYPATIPIFLVQLALHGSKLEPVLRRLSTAMEEFGLEDAVDELKNDIENNRDLEAIAPKKRTTGPTKALYAGITWTVAPWERVEKDITNGSAVLLVNFLKANLDLLSHKTFHLPSLDIPMRSKYESQTNEEISDVERIIRAVLGERAMNSAEGGNRPIYGPTPALALLRSTAFALLPSVNDHPLGQDHNPILENKIRSLIDEENNIFTKAGFSPISSRGLEGVKDTGACLRMLKGRVVKMEVAKDITQEVHTGVTGNYWDKDAGQGPREHHHLLRLFHPISTECGVTHDEVAEYSGPLIDLWRVVLNRSHYSLHALFLTRLITAIQPLLIVSQSRDVAATLRHGILPVIAKRFPEAELAAKISGNEAHVLFEELSADRPPNEVIPGQFLHSLGTLSIIQTGSDPASQSILIPRGHSGRLKHDPSLAWPLWMVDFLVTLNAELVAQILARRLQTEEAVDWSDPESTRRWLEQAKEEAEGILLRAGVSHALLLAKADVHRAETTLSFLRCLTATKRRHERWVQGLIVTTYQRRDGLKTSASGPARIQQLQEILKQARELESHGLNPDPGHLAPFMFPILSAEFQSHFLALRPNKDIVYVANALGGSKEAYERVLQNRAAIGQWSAENRRIVYVDTVGIARNNVTKAIRQLAAPAPLFIGEMLQNWRTASCPGCNLIILGKHNAAYHRCIKSDGYVDIPLTQTSFPTLERLLFIHELLNDQVLMDEVGGLDRMISDAGLCRIRVQSILQENWFWVALKDVLPNRDIRVAKSLTIADSVYLPQQSADNRGLITTLVFDVLLLHAAGAMDICAADRTGWKPTESSLVKTWLRDRSKLYLVQCSGPSGNYNPPHTFISDKVTVPKKEFVFVSIVALLISPY
ncbi:hypothetical protein C8R46DRAFT_1225835 [Mycena filopes]|nr:hypothetical protein C8R46DRAFT_1225835 [Mycena filopes]